MSQQYNQGNQNGQPIIINVQNTNTNTNNIGGAQMYSTKNKWVAFLLCFFTGALGFHRFYVGKIGTGIIYLCTLGLCGIGVIVDCITILIGSFKDKKGYRLK